MRWAAAAILLWASTSNALTDYDPYHAPTIDTLACKATQIVVAKIRIHPLGIQSRDLGWWEVWTRVDLIVSRSILAVTGAATPDTISSFMLGGNFRKIGGKLARANSEDEPFSECGCDGAKCLIFLTEWSPPDSRAVRGRVFRPVGMDKRAILPLDSDGNVSNVPLRIMGEYCHATLSLEDCIARIRAARAAAGFR